MLVLSNSARRMRLRLCTMVQDNCKSLWIKASAKWLNVNVNVRQGMSKNSQHFSPTTSKSCRFSPQCRAQRLSWEGPHCRTQDPKGAVWSRSNSSHLIDLNLLVTTPWSLNPPIPTSKPTNRHPLNVDPTPPPGPLFCSEGLSKGLLHRNQLC